MHQWVYLGMQFPKSGIFPMENSENSQTSVNDSADRESIGGSKKENAQSARKRSFQDEKQRNSHDDDFMELDEFEMRVEKIIGAASTESMVRFFEERGVIENEKVHIGKLQSALQETFGAAASLLIKVIMRK